MHFIILYILKMNRALHYLFMASPMNSYLIIQFVHFFGQIYIDYSSIQNIFGFLTMRLDMYFLIGGLGVGCIVQQSQNNKCSSDERKVQKSSNKQRNRGQMKERILQ